MGRDLFAEHEEAERARRAAGQVDGKHFSEYVPEVKALLKAGDDDAAAGLLLRLIDAVEREGRIPLAGSVGVPRWYSETLEKIYERHGLTAELGVLRQRMHKLDIEVQTQGAIKLQQLKAAAGATTARKGTRKTKAGKVVKQSTPYSASDVSNGVAVFGIGLLLILLFKACSG